MEISNQSFAIKSSALKHPNAEAPAPPPAQFLQGEQLFNLIQFIAFST